METLLKEKDPALYLLLRYDEESPKQSVKIMRMINKLITFYKMEDETIIEIIKELNNKIASRPKSIYRNDISSKYLHLIKTSIDKLGDFSLFMDFLNRSETPMDFLILLEVLDYKLDHLSKKEITKFVDSMIDSPLKVMIDMLLVRDIENYFEVNFQINKLFKMLALSDRHEVTEMFRKVLYSKRINDLSPDLIIKAAKRISLDLDIDYLRLIQEVCLKYVNDFKILEAIKDKLVIENSELKVKIEVASLYNELYVSTRKVKMSQKHLAPNMSKVLSGYSRATLRSFVSGLEGCLVNKSLKDNAGYITEDLVSCFIKLSKPDLALQIFNKKEYKPIEKSKRRAVMKPNYAFLNSRFDEKLDVIINACINSVSYEVLLEILKSNKVDSMSIGSLQRILVNTTYKGSTHTKGGYKICPRDVRESIVETVKDRIVKGDLEIYYNRRDASEKFHGFICDKKSALDFIDCVIEHNDYDFAKAFNLVLAPGQQN